MTLVTSLVSVADLVKAKIEAEQVSLGVQKVFYGDQTRIAEVPAVCVETGLKSLELAGVSRKMDVIITVYIMVYHAQLNSTLQTTRRDDDALMESIEDLIHQDPFLMNGGSNQNVIHSFVRNIEPGVANKSGTVFRAGRMTFEAKTQAILPGL